VILSANGVPVVKRIAPTLAGGAEIVRRHARDNLWQEIVFPQPKQAAIGPDIGAVVIHEDGYVANDADVFLRAILADGAPLFPEEELNDASDREIGVCAQQKLV